MKVVGSFYYLMAFHLGKFSVYLKALTQRNTGFLLWLLKALVLTDLGYTPYKNADFMF